MSFYLGKDTNNRGVMHITKGYRTSSELRGGILDDTVFHSDLPYVQYTAYEATLIPITGELTNNNYGLSIPETVITAMDSQVFCYLIEHNGEIKLYETYLPQLPFISLYSEAGIHEAVHRARYAWTNNTFNEVRAYRGSVHRLPAIRLSNPSEVTNVWVVILDTGITHNTNTSETVYVGKGRLDIDGTSLTTYRYITSVPVNNIDPVVYTPNGDPIQFINFYTGTETSLSIASNSGRTTIRSDDKEIFDSGVARGKVIFDEISTLEHPQATIVNNGTVNRVIATGMQNGDLFSFFTVVSGGGYSFNTIGLGVFRQNTSIVVGEVGFVYHYNIYYDSVVCTDDGRLLYRTTVQPHNGILTLHKVYSYLTHYK